MKAGEEKGVSIVGVEMGGSEREEGHAAHVACQRASTRSQLRSKYHRVLLHPGVN